MQTASLNESLDKDVPTAIMEILTELLRQEAAFSQVDVLIERLQRWVGCRCIGMRLFAADGFLAYSSYLGFSQEFWVAENILSVDEDSCACTRVATQQPEPQDLPMITAHGSFHCNQLPEFIETLAEGELSRYRCRCVAVGFRSLAVIPVHAYGRVIGVLHLADERADQISPAVVRQLEQLTEVIGAIVARHSSLTSQPRPLVAHGNLSSLLGGLKAIAYVVDPVDYRILYANQKLLDLLPGDTLGGRCYQVLHGRNQPCSDCSSAVERRRGRLLRVRAGGVLPEQSYLVADRAILWADRHEAWLGLGVPLLDGEQGEVQAAFASAGNDCVAPEETESRL